MPPFQPRTFGRLGVKVHPLGISASYGLDGAGVEEAVEKGINYIYYGSMRRGSFGDGLRRVAKKRREDLIIVLQSYMRWAPLEQWDVDRGLRDLQIDYADVLLLGWHDKWPGQSLIDRGRELQAAGKVRYLGLSTHNRELIPQLEKDKIFDLYHVRYNAAHRGAEEEVFPFIDPVSGPGMTAFTATRWGQLLDPSKMPPGERNLTAGDAYRFCLSSPNIHTVATGLKNPEQLRHALDALEKGPLSEDEMAWVRRVGDHLHRKKFFLPGR